MNHLEELERAREQFIRQFKQKPEPFWLKALSWLALVVFIIGVFEFVIWMWK